MSRPKDRLVTIRVDRPDGTTAQRTLTEVETLALITALQLAPNGIRELAKANPQATTMPYRAEAAAVLEEFIFPLDEKMQVPATGTSS